MYLRGSKWNMTRRTRRRSNPLKINLRAAREIARQLRLRDIGGLIVTDFIDLLEEKNRRKVYDEMKRHIRQDRAKTDIAPLSQFGILEMTRQRLRPALLFTFNEPCPTCRGMGMVPSLETILTKLERWINRFRNSTKEPRVRLTVHPEVANALQAEKKYLLGLLTGNIEEGAGIKLDHFGLNSFFPIGAFGSDDEDRNKLLPLGVKKLRRRHDISIGFSDCVVIGDTPRDVDCSKPFGALSIGVATGSYSAKELTEAGADIVFQDLSDTGGLLAAVGSLGG